MLSLISLHENNFFGIMSFLQGQKKKKSGLGQINLNQDLDEVLGCC